MAIPSTSTEEQKAIINTQPFQYFVIPQPPQEEIGDCPAVCYYDDDDEDCTITITPKEPDNSQSLGDEHLDTISATESNEFIKSSVENLVPNPSESEGKHECDVPACEDFSTFSNILFDVDYDFSSNDDQSFYDEDIPKEIYSNPLFDEEIISMKIDPHHFNAEYDLTESLLNDDSLIISSSLNIDSLFDEFAGELTLLKSIPPGINETDYDYEKEFRLIKRLLYDNSSPRPPKELISENSDTAFKSFSPFPILVEDNDTFMEEIDLSFTPNDQMPPAIRKMTMTLKRISSSSKNCLAMIPSHFLKMSHFILIFLHPLVLLQNHWMVKEKQEKDKIGSKPDQNRTKTESVKNKREKDKIRTKPDKNGKRGENRKSQE
nr:hypothetical protein [Tanacetum cinerariifolium]